MNATHTTLEHLSGSVYKIILLFALSGLCFVSIYSSGWSTTTKGNSLVFSIIDNFYFNDSKYLVSNSKCKILNLDPLDPEILPFFKPQKYTSCTKNPLLTYVTKIDNIATLRINTEVIPSYTTNNFTCCYANITRRENKKDPDNKVEISSCEEFKDNVTIPNFVLIKCLDLKTQENIYENAHAVVTATAPVNTKMKKFNDTATNPFSVTFIAIDSVSRLNLIRSLPLTHQFLEDNNWFPLEGYNKIGDNTFPNLIGILTGFNESYAYTTCNPKKLNKLDQCPLIWYSYRNFSYITAYAEDESWMSTFNYRKKGFKRPPTDYYFRPYVIATEKLKTVKKSGMKYCTGPETAGERIMNLARDFLLTFKDYPTFSLFWMNSFSHNDLNTASGMDAKIKTFLEDISKRGATENSFVVFLSDHGMRFGKSRYTSVGWLEERRPFIYISIPERFKKQFPEEYKNLKSQRHHLTTPYDLHMTLQHLLVLSGFNYTIKPSNACPKCKSLFVEPEHERSCEDAAIQQHWCTCAAYTPLNKSNEITTKMSKYIVDQIQGILREGENSSKCANYSVNKIITASISEHFTYKNATYIVMVIETKPTAVFEGTILYINGTKEEFQLKGGISRVDSYHSHSNCINDAFLKKYCYCK